MEVFKKDVVQPGVKGWNCQFKDQPHSVKVITSFRSQLIQQTRPYLTTKTLSLCVLCAGANCLQQPRCHYTPLSVNYRIQYREQESPPQMGKLTPSLIHSLNIVWKEMTLRICSQDFENNQIVEKMELTNVVSTPDLYISESDDENNVQENMNGPR